MSHPATEHSSRKNKFRLLAVFFLDVLEQPGSHQIIQVGIRRARLERAHIVKQLDHMGLEFPLLRFVARYIRISILGNELNPRMP